jgi:hypothetical protein
MILAGEILIVAWLAVSDPPFKSTQGVGDQLRSLHKAPRFKQNRGHRTAQSGGSNID